jgi:hypothetical protein
MLWQRAISRTTGKILLFGLDDSDYQRKTSFVAGILARRRF